MEETIAALKRIQQKLKAPKGQYNNFGKFNYRSCEDILEAVKPLLKEEDALLTLSDELVQVGERYYVQATAMFTKGEDSLEVTSYAREADDKKGMDESQITGTASSYARKYALNGLFLIDDTKDADTDEFHEATSKKGASAGKLDFKAVRERLTEIDNIDDLNKYWFELKLTKKQEDVLKSDFTKRKIKIGAGV